MSTEHRPQDLEDLVGEGLAEEELAQLRRVDGLLRSVPPPPELPTRLALPGQAGRRPAVSWTRRRTLAAVALAAALSALFFGLGTRIGADGFAEQAAVPMSATEQAPGAAAVIRVGERDERGNRLIRFEASGLEPLPEGGYYLLWIEKDGEYAGPCGSFAVGSDGATEAEWTVSYDLGDADAWVVSARVPGEQSDEAPRVLEAAVDL